jgi:hypothetical protein
VHETTLHYLDSCNYARQLLGDEIAALYFPRLHKLAKTNSPEELQSIVRGWRRPLPKEEPKPEPPPQAEPPQPTKPIWKPCRHFGGSRECSTCLKRNTAAGVRLAGAMALANEMYNQHRRFVLDRLRTELMPFTDGKPYSAFDDLEQMCWQAVASGIAKYEDQSTPLAWLKKIVHGTVVDHFRRLGATKRGTALTDQLIGDPVEYDASGVLNPPEKPTRPSGAAPDGDGDLMKAAFWAGFSQIAK